MVCGWVGGWGGVDVCGDAEIGVYTWECVYMGVCMHGSVNT